MSFKSVSDVYANVENNKSHFPQETNVGYRNVNFTPKINSLNNSTFTPPLASQNMNKTTYTPPHIYINKPNSTPTNVNVNVNVNRHISITQPAFIPQPINMGKSNEVKTNINTNSVNVVSRPIYNPPNIISNNPPFTQYPNNVNVTQPSFILQSKSVNIPSIISSPTISNRVINDINKNRMSSSVSYILPNITPQHQNNQANSCLVNNFNNLSCSSGGPPIRVKMKMRNKEVINPYDVYIGRRFCMGGWNLADSEFKNDFKVKQYGRDNCLRLYAEHLNNNSYLLEKLKTLSGKRIGCFCELNEDCHGDILISKGRELGYW